MEPTKTFQYSVIFANAQQVAALAENLNALGLNGFRLVTAQVMPNGGALAIMERETPKG
jgi:hypothetical protein